MRALHSGAVEGGALARQTRGAERERLSIDGEQHPALPARRREGRHGSPSVDTARRRSGRELRVTPTMEAEIAHHMWSLGELLAA